MNTSLPQKLTVAIQGVVIPVSWDSCGEPTALAVAGFDEREYRLVHDEAFGGLYACIGQSVIVEGRRIERDKTTWLMVESYKTG